MTIVLLCVKKMLSPHPTPAISVLWLHRKYIWSISQNWTEKWQSSRGSLQTRLWDSHTLLPFESFCWGLCVWMLNRTKSSVLCMDVCMHIWKNIRVWVGACGLSKPGPSMSPVVANSKCLPQNILPASTSTWFRDSLSQSLCLCVFAFNNTSQQVSLPYACLYSCVLPNTSNDLFWFQPRNHHRPSALHWSLVKKHLSLAWLWITPTWSMVWCTNMSAAQESNPLSWRKSWNQKVASISLQRYQETRGQLHS